MTYQPLESGEYTTALVSDGGGTITLNGGLDTLLWTKWPRDKGGYSLVRIQGHIQVGSVSTPSGEVRMDLPFDQAPGPPADSDALDFYVPVWLNNWGGSVGAIGKWGKMFMADTVSHQAFGRISDGNDDGDIADAAVAGASILIGGITYFTDDDTPQA